MVLLLNKLEFSPSTCLRILLNWPTGSGTDHFFLLLFHISPRKGVSVVLLFKQKWIFVHAKIERFCYYLTLVTGVHFNWKKPKNKRCSGGSREETFETVVNILVFYMCTYVVLLAKGVVFYMIDWFEFYAVSAVFPPYNGGNLCMKMTSLKVLKFHHRSIRAYSSSRWWVENMYSFQKDRQTDRQITKGGQKSSPSVRLKGHLNVKKILKFVTCRMPRCQTNKRICLTLSCTQRSDSTRPMRMLKQKTIQI